MLRVLLISLFLLAAPFVVYVVWFRIYRNGSKTETMWRDAPIVELSIAGVVLAVTGLVGLMALTGF